VIELDEHYHKSINMSKELARQHSICDAYPEQKIFFIRYNPDQEGGLSDEKLSHCLTCINDVLGSRFQLAHKSPFNYHVDYIGYPRKRFDNLCQRFTEVYGHPANHMAFIEPV